jgi:hypothetical protein
MRNISKMYLLALCSVASFTFGVGTIAFLNVDTLTNLSFVSTIFFLLGVLYYRQAARTSTSDVTSRKPKTI